MGATDGEVADSTLTRALGEELRRARVDNGWTRARVVERMPSEIQIRTLAAYEQGTRPCTVVRLVEICRILGVAPPDVLRRALQRAEIDLQSAGTWVDLRAVASDERAEFEPLRRWARQRIAHNPDDEETIRLDHAFIQAMAALLNFTQSELVHYLNMFPPGTHAK